MTFRMPPSHPDPMYHPPLGDLEYGDMSDGSADDDSEPEYSFDDDVFGDEDQLAMYAIAGMGGGGDDVWDFMDLPDVQSWYFHGD